VNVLAGFGCPPPFSCGLFGSCGTNALRCDTVPLMKLACDENFPRACADAPALAEPREVSNPSQNRQSDKGLPLRCRQPSGASRMYC
jgi:hypothetical protein